MIPMNTWKRPQLSKHENTTKKHTKTETYDETLKEIQNKKQ